MEKAGEFRLSDLMAVVRHLELLDPAAATEGRPAPEKMEAAKHPEDIFGDGLHHVLELYEWGTLRPLTDNGVTVSGFWDTRTGESPPQGYVMDESGKFLRRMAG